MILSGDQLYQMDYRSIVEYHKKSKADITIAAKPVPAEEASGLGIMKVQKDGRAVAFLEKPKADELSESQFARSTSDPRFLASMGIYVFPKQLLVDILMESTAVDFGKELIPQSLEKYKVMSYVFDRYWQDIGTIRSFYEANLALTGPSPEFSFYNINTPIFTHPRKLPCSKLNNCVVHQSIIAEGCTLSGAEISHSIIGVRSRIGNGTTIKHSIVMGADRFETFAQMEENTAKKMPNMGIGNHCTIINAIIDKDARIGDNVSIINAHNLQEKDEDSYNIRDGIIVVPKGAVIKNGTVI
jgi:glucose-1-phosphate adenylyltransferase